MKKSVLIIMVLCFFANANAQESATQEIKEAVAENFNIWLKKSDFETNAEYEKRVKMNYEGVLKKITQETALQIKKEYSRYCRLFLRNYDAEKESFKLELVYCEHGKISGKSTFQIKINKVKAKQFAEYYGGDARSFIVIKDVSMINDRWEITKATFCFGGGLNNAYWTPDDKEYIKIKIDNNTNFAPPNYQNYYKTYTYDWSIENQPNYTPSEVKPISFSLEDLNITLPGTITPDTPNTVAKTEQKIVDPNSATKEIKNAISKNFNEWLKKSDFETNADYEKRVKTQADEALKKISDETTLEIKNRNLRQIAIDIEQYDVENEVFTLRLRGNFYDKAIYIKLNRQIAENFNQSFKREGGGSRPDFEISDVALVNDQWIPTKGILYFPYREDVYYGTKRIYKKLDYSTNYIDTQGFYSYDWNIENQPNYTPSTVKPIAFNLEDLNITLPAGLTSTASTAVAKSDEPDLDIAKVKTLNSNPDAVAVVIGNKEYENTKKVSYAINDASEMKKYLINALGYKESNIIYIENANKSKFDILFGTNDNPEGKLFNSIKQGMSDVFVYYSGHGAPGLKDNKGYFVPVDCDPNYMEQTGYSLDLFYKNLAKLNAKSVTVVTDACFSGAELFKNISPITITVSNPIVLTPNCVVLSSSTGTQVSSWFNEKNHGIFTYFFLRAMQDKEKCDTNKDNKLTFKEIADYVSDKTQGVPSCARKLHNVDQNPTIQGTGIDNFFVEYKTL